MEFSKSRQTAIVNPIRKVSSKSPGIDYAPTGTTNPTVTNSGSLTNLLSLSEKSDRSNSQDTTEGKIDINSNYLVILSILLVYSNTNYDTNSNNSS